MNEEEIEREKILSLLAKLRDIFPFDKAKDIDTGYSGEGQWSSSAITGNSDECLRTIISHIKNSNNKSVITKEHNEIKNINIKVLDEYKNGNIVVFGMNGGLITMPIKEFIKQPAEGMLFDLNRTEAVILTFIKDPKWINDYALAKTVIELKNRIDEIDSINKESKSQYDMIYKAIEKDNPNWLKHYLE